MTYWNHVVDAAPRDGTWVLIMTEFDEPACVYWRTEDNGYEFGWTSDGGDRYSPKAWAAVTDLYGKAIKR